MLKGIDISHWNNQKVITSDLDFVICKATEGTNYKDKTFLSNMKKCDELGIELVGAYHYAKTNQNVLENVDNFINTIIKAKQFTRSMILALDVEGEDIKRPNTVSWVLDWLNLVYIATGIKPLLYTSASYSKMFKVVADNDFGLWIAHWNKEKPKYSHWKFWALWQYAVIDNLDRDFFNGTKEQYIKYCITHKEGE